MPHELRAEILERVAAAAARIDALGWGEATAGNLSLLLDAEAVGARFRPAPRPVVTERLSAAETWPPNRLLLISGTGTRMREIAEDPARGLCLIGSVAGRLHASESSVAPSSELPVHLTVQARRETDSALLHSHPDFLIALSHFTALKGEGALTRALLPLMPETHLFLGRGLKRLDFELPGSAALAATSAAALHEADILVWDRHGALATGTSLVEALDRLELAEKAARVWWIAHQLGEKPAGLPVALFERLGSRLTER